MSKYQDVESFLNSYAAKKKKIPITAQVVMLAIAKECDRQQAESVSLSDDEVLNLTNAELFIQTKRFAKKIMSLIAERDVEEDEATQFIGFYLYNNPAQDGGDLLEMIYKEYNILSKLPKKKQKERMKVFKELADMVSNETYGSC